MDEDVVKAFEEIFSICKNKRWFQLTYSAVENEWELQIATRYEDEYVAGKHLGEILTNLKQVVEDERIVDEKQR